MHSSLFFKLFPPPKFLLMPHAGIDISDDAISFVEYSRPVGNREIVRYGLVPLESGIMEGGDIKNQDKLIEVLTEFVRKYGINYARMSIPEEKAYLFETEVPYGDMDTVSQNIEFKLEENIPLAATDTVFAFDLLTGDHSRPWRASVSAVPKTYIEHMMDIFRKAGIIPIAFETTPRAIARIVSYGEPVDTIVVHSMKSKTGVYVLSEHAIGFTSTIAAGYTESDISKYTDILANEVRRVHSYWLSRDENVNQVIKKVVVVGHDAESVTNILRVKVSDILPVETVDIWRDVLDTTKYVPPIERLDSFDYVASAGLAL